MWETGRKEIHKMNEYIYNWIFSSKISMVDGELFLIVQFCIYIWQRHQSIYTYAMYDIA